MRIACRLLVVAGIGPGMGAGIGCSSKGHAPRLAADTPMPIVLGDCQPLVGPWTSGPRPLAPPTGAAPAPATEYAFVLDPGDVVTPPPGHSLPAATLGQGSGFGFGDGSGNGRDAGQRSGLDGSTAAPLLGLGDVDGDSDSDKAIIRRYLKRNLMKVQACYERALDQQADLGGTVKASFFIDPSGHVTDSSATGVDAAVSKCVAAVIAGIEFPRPKGGGGVKVNYPFAFRSAGASGPGKGSATANVTQHAVITAAAAAAAAPEPEAAPTPAALRAPDFTPYVPGASSPLRGVTTSLSDCLRKGSVSAGVAVVELAYDSSGTAHTVRLLGSHDAAVTGCVATALRGTKRAVPGTSVERCSFAYGTMTIADLPAFDLMLTTKTFAGAPSPTSAALGGAVHTRLEHVVRNPDDVTVDGPIVIRAAPTTAMREVYPVLHAILDGGGDFVLATQRGATWGPLAPIALPVVPVPVGTGARWSRFAAPVRGAPDTEDVVLAIRVSKEEIVLGTSRINEFVVITDRSKLLEGLQREKASAFFSNRQDVQIAADPDVAYADLVTVIDAVTHAGFPQWRLVDVESLAAVAEY